MAMAGFPRLGRIGRAALFAAALALLGGGEAGAQFGMHGDARKTDKNAPIVFQADEVQYDDQLGLTVAKGHVEISQNDEVLLADTVSYSRNTDTVTASGHVSL